MSTRHWKYLGLQIFAALGAIGHVVIDKRIGFESIFLTMIVIVLHFARRPAPSPPADE